MIVARLSCTCYASASPPERPDLKLTTPACVSSAAPVQAGGGSMSSPDVPESSEQLSVHHRVGPGVSGPSCRLRAVGAMMLLYLAAVVLRCLGGGWVMEGRWPVGRREADGWRRAAAGWPSGAGWGHGRAEGVPGAPPGLQRTCDARGGVALAFCSVLLDIVFAHVRVSMCARTYSKVKVVYHSRLPGHVVDGRARSGERSSELWTGVESRDL